MTRLACFFVLIALVAVTILACNPSGPTAIGFSFIGLPALVVGILIHGIQLWREGAFSGNGQSRKEIP